METKDRLGGETIKNPVANTKGLSMVEKASQVGLLFCVNSQNDLQPVVDFVEAIGDEMDGVSALLLFLGKSTPALDHPKIFWVDKNDYKLFGQKKDRLKDWLQMHSFDLFISFVQSDEKKCNQLLEEMQARLKIGPPPSHGSQLVDLSVAVPGGKMDYAAFYEQIKFYLNQLKINIQ